MSTLFNDLALTEAQIESNYPLKCLNKLHKHVPIYNDKSNTYFGHSGPLGLTGSHNVFVGSSIKNIEGLTGSTMVGANINGASAVSGSILLGENAMYSGHSGSSMVCFGGTGTLCPVITGQTGPTGSAYVHIPISYCGTVYRVLATTDY